MLHIRMLSGEEVASVPVDTLSSVRELKQLGDEMNPKIGARLPYPTIILIN